jgi:DNA-binding NarL/FixJ family response regulator
MPLKSLPATPLEIPGDKNTLDPAKSQAQPNMAAKITVLLADDHTVVRQGLRMLLETEPDITVVGEAETGRQALQMVKKLRPDVVVMDIGMPQLNGLEATRLILKDAPDTRVLVLSAYSDDDYVHQLTEAGAAGYLLKQTAAADLIKGVREVRRGNAFFSPAILKRILQNYRQAFLRSIPVREGSNPLTSREAEVVQLIAEGKANKQIAPELGISIKTVEKHRQLAMNKLNIHDVAGLTRYAISKGIIEGGVGPLPLPDKAVGG